MASAGEPALVHQLLDLLELLSRGEVGGQADAGGGSQLDDGVLGEVFDPAADVAGPLVLHGVGGHVHRAKASSLSQPVMLPLWST